MTLVEKIKILANNQNISFSAIEKELGFGNGTIKKWDTSSPSCDKLLKLANFLNTSLDALLCAENISQLSTQKYEYLISLYENVTDEDRLRVINYLELANSIPLSSNINSNSNN